MPLIPSTTNEKPSNSETAVDVDMSTATMRRKIEAAMEDNQATGGRDSSIHPASTLGIHGNQNGSSAMDESKETVASIASKANSEAEQAADKLYMERIEDEYAKRDGGA